MMILHPIQFQLIDINGYLSLATYVHYFVPGSLKIQNIIIPFRKRVIEPSFTRRWMQKGEAPYPGYCRAPGSSQCVPLFCNCEQLSEIWAKIKETDEKLKRNKLRLNIT